MALTTAMLQLAEPRGIRLRSGMQSTKSSMLQRRLVWVLGVLTLGHAEVGSGEAKLGVAAGSRGTSQEDGALGRCLLTRSDNDIAPWGGASGEPRCAITGSGWVLTQLPNGSGVAVPPPCQASPPSSITMDLARCGAVGPPFAGDHDSSDVWVGWQGWQYELSGACIPTVPDDGTVLLVAESLDTYSTVSVNNVVVGRSKSTHLRGVFDITAAVRPGCDNTVTVVFTSSLVEGRGRERENEAANGSAHVFVKAFTDSDAAGCHPPLYPSNPTKKSAASGVPNDDGRIWVRKGTSDYGWNWGPCFTAGGILRPIRVVSFGPQTAILQDMVRDESRLHPFC